MAFDKGIPLGTSLLMATLAALYSAGCGGSAFSDSSSSAGSSSAGTGAGGSDTGGTGQVCNIACTLIGCGPGTKSVLQPGACCSTCVSDGQGGASGGSGSTGTGGCSTASACPDVACAAGYTTMVEPGNCCPTCVPNGNGGSAGQSGCESMTCPALDCAQEEVKPGDCCATCVVSCQLGQQGYATLKQRLLQQSAATTCKIDTDCAAVSNNASCGDQCTASPVNVTSKPSIDQQLSFYAQNNCSSCMPIYPPCALPPPPICSAGHCVSGFYL